MSDSVPSHPASDPAAGAAPTPGWIGLDWAAVIVAAVFVLLAVLHLLPTIPFLVR